MPLLPTTPFMLLAAFCFSRGSRQNRFFVCRWVSPGIHLDPPIAAGDSALTTVHGFRNTSQSTWHFASRNESIRLNRAVTKQGGRESTQRMGVTFIELQTYRRTGHAEHDSQQYVPTGEVDGWADENDPIDPYIAKLTTETGWYSAAELSAVIGARGTANVI